MKKETILATIIVIISTLFMSCTKDSDEDVQIESYIKGTWHTYKVTYSFQDQSIDREVTKTNSFSSVYWELTFKDKGIVETSHYEEDSNKISRWKTDTNKYNIKGNIITISDNESSADLFFNQSDRTIYMRMAGEIEDVGYVTIFVYLCK